MCCFCIGNILVATAPPDQTYWAEIFVATLITPFGMDISFPAASLIVSNTIPEQQQGVAASMVNMAINWSISFGLGIAGTVQSQIIKNGKSNLPLDGYRKPASNEHEKSPADVIPPIAASENGIDLHKINSNETDGTFPMTYRF
jgi:MFS family permease